MDELKTAFFINRFKSKFSALERVYGKVEIIEKHKQELLNEAARFVQEKMNKLLLFVSS